MNRRFLKRCLVWLLPLLVVHSLVPVGFMAALGTSGVEIAFCPVQSARVVEVLSEVRAADDHARHLGAHAIHHDVGDGAAQSVGGEDAEHSQHARSTSCPYALSGSPMLAATVSILPVAFVRIPHSRPADLVAPPGVTFFGSNRIRGPPHFA